MLGVVVVWFLARDSDPEADPEWADPEPEVADATGEFLANDGRPLSDLLDFTDGLEDRLSDVEPGDGCAGLLEERRAISDDRQMLELLREIPDPVLGRLWVEQLDAANKALQLCDNGLRGPSIEAAALADEWQQQLERRLDQLQVIR